MTGSSRTSATIPAYWFVPIFGSNLGVMLGLPKARALSHFLSPYAPLIRTTAASFLTMREHSTGVYCSGHCQRWSEAEHKD